MKNRHGIAILDRPIRPRDRAPQPQTKPAAPLLADLPIPRCAGDGCTKRGLISRDAERWYCPDCLTPALIREGRA
ncbi:hypothetical protein [Candidatus Nitrospira bockiana]